MRLCSFIATAALLSPLQANQAKAPLQPPVDLRCDGVLEPLGGAKNPRLTWRIVSKLRGVNPSAWQVLVASSDQLLAKGQGDLWDSGKVQAERDMGLSYAGKDLTSGGRYHWKVRWWDSDEEPSAWSKPSVWEVAPLTPADWQGAQWMNDGLENPTKDEDFYKEDRAPLMRREFKIEKPVVRARLYVAGLGLCMPSLNGEVLTDHVFDPPWTNFDKRILFRTHDLTGQLSEGTHCLGLALGNGWYNPLPLRMWGHRNIRGSLPVGRPRAIACLVVEHPDGTHTTITSGSEWTTAPGPTLRNSIYLGEERDARLEKAGWDKAGFTDPAWKPVALTNAPLEPLQPLHMPPARKLEPISAKKITTPAEGIHIVDFGENFTGLPELRLRAPAGTRVTLRFGELLHEDGTLNPMTSVCGQIKGTREGPDGKPMSKGGPGAPDIAWQQSVYIAAGTGEEVFIPRFTFHAFRYMEITGLPKAPKPIDCRAFPMHTDLASAGSFSSSNDDLNRIQEMCRRTFLANVVTVQSDCPHRERFGYGGDIVATSEAYLMNFDMAGFYAKTVRDWSDTSQPDGNFTDTAPFVGIQYCGVGWAMVHPLLMEQLYQHYGDRRLIKQELPAAVRWFNLEASKREKGGLVMKGLGDHEALKRIAGPAITTPMFIDTARRMARLCRIVEDQANAERFDKMAEESAGAWVKAFLSDESGTVGDGSQTEQTLALAWGHLSEPAQERVFGQLLKDLMKAEDAPSLSTGIFGTRFLLEELSRRGRTDLAYDLASRKTFPSWGWMLENGATTLWEDWKGTDNVKSHNHPMFGSISGWFFRWLGGIQCAEDAVAFDRILIRPQLVDGLDSVKTSHRSVRGEIISNWTTNGSETEFEIVIPPTSEATIEIPFPKGHLISETGRAPQDAPGIKEFEMNAGSCRMKIGSGHYHFKIFPSR